MKKFVLIAAALTLSLASFAQENGTDRRQRGGRPERPDEATMIKMRTERMVEELGLDEAQGAKLLELNQKYPQAMMGPGGPGGPGRCLSLKKVDSQQRVNNVSFTHRETAKVL